MARGKCHCGKQQNLVGNCPTCSEDGHPLQCVGPWSVEKHEYLKRYIDATREVRASFGRGGSAFIDIFAGPGRAKRTDTGEFVNGSPLIAAQYSKVPFSHLVFAEAAEENVSALRARTAPFTDRVQIVPGDSHQNIRDIVSRVPQAGLCLAFIDPFGPSGLRWSTIETLAQVQRMDMIIHFPTMGTRRNEPFVDFEAMVGPGNVEGEGHLVQRLVKRLKENLKTLGYAKDDSVRDIPVKNNQGGLLYHLIFATKHPLGTKIWKSVVKTGATGQRGFGW